MSPRPSSLGAGLGSLSIAGQTPASLPWPRLIQGTLLKRYKRFLVDVRLGNGHTVTAHCPNSGSMATCSEPGRPVYLSRSTNTARRLPYTWEMIEMPGSLVGINTLTPNRLVRAALLGASIPGIEDYDRVRPEIPYGRNSRIDLLLERGEARCFIEVKNCTLVTDGIAYFPDAVTSRGLKHLQELEAQVRQGHRAVIFFLIQRMDARLFKPADTIDPAYGQALRTAARTGVEVMAYDVRLDLERIKLNGPVPIRL